MAMTSLERAICAAVKNAHKRYETITGNWLYHAPEHFLQNYIFNSLGKTYEVYAEASRAKIAQGHGRPPRGRPPNKNAYRYDLVVWHNTPKTKNPLKAVIEVKRSTRRAHLDNDARRVKKALSGPQSAKSGYVLVYSEDKKEKGKASLERKFKLWASELNLKLVNRTGLILSQADDEWICGFALMRAV